MDRVDIDSPSHELQRDPEVEKLSRELFFHFVNPRTYAITVANDIIERGGCLMSIAGRATLRRGFPDTYGPNLVFRVPEISQQLLLTTDLDSSTDLGLTSGKGKIFALLQRFHLPITSAQEEAIFRWLRSPHRSETMKRLLGQPIGDILSMIRYIDSSYFVGLFDIEEDKGRRDIRTAEKLIHPFVQNVRRIISNPKNLLDNYLLENAINHFIRYNPLNKAAWRR